jgi:hypothetical protein
MTKVVARVFSGSEIAGSLPLHISGKSRCKSQEEAIFMPSPVCSRLQRQEVRKQFLSCPAEKEK